MGHDADRIRHALQDPAGAFGAPEAVVRDPSLSRAEKLAILTSWENDARELAVAEEENMGGGEPSLLAEVVAARRRLEPAADHGEASAAHKQGGVAPDPSVFRVRHCMRPPGTAVHPDHGLDEASLRLGAESRTVLPVADGDQVVGVITRHEIEAGERASVTAPKPVTVRHVMTTGLGFCYVDDDAGTARALMDRRGTDHLLVIDADDRLIGIVGRHDLPAGSAGDATASAPDAGWRETSSQGLASTVQPGGLDVYADAPKIKLGPDRA